MNARIYEVTDDNGKIIESEKKYSEVDSQEYNNEDSGVIKVKTFSDISGFDLKDTPKTSKIDGKFTTLKIKEFSYFGEVSVIEEDNFSDNTIKEQPEQKEFTQVAVKDRLRECKMSPRMYFRRMIISYKQVVKSFGGPDKIKPEDKKILQALLTSDVLYILGQISSEVIEKNKQINTLLGCSSISKNLRQSAQSLQLIYRMAGREAQKQGFVSKMRYQKLREAWGDFVKSVIEEVFGANHANIPTEEETNIEEGK